jgi:hypothetical protein
MCCLLELGADVNMKNNVSAATSGVAVVVNSGVAVMVEMVGCGGEGWCGGSCGVWQNNVNMKWDMKWSDDMRYRKPAEILLAQ